MDANTLGWSFDRVRTSTWNLSGSPATGKAMSGKLRAPRSASAAESRVPFPTIPKASGEDIHQGIPIRTEHMNLLLHQRDETMRKGIRPKNERLQSCLSCHAVKGDDGHAVSYQN